jgi:acetolactate synthase-1/3 small subunit
MRSYGEIEVTRSGSVAVSLEPRKLRLSSPVPAGVTKSQTPANGVLNG